ncbi:MAG TPA: hypothetical protein PLP17_03650 [Oligoflexia bacterium]|nr:hypothetical protein [Oligoflexia bacterium]
MDRIEKFALAFYLLLLIATAQAGGAGQAIMTVFFPRAAVQPGLHLAGPAMARPLVPAGDALCERYGTLRYHRCGPNYLMLNR